MHRAFNASRLRGRPLPKKDPRFLPTLAERNAAAFIARPKEVYRRERQQNVEPSRPELQMDLRCAHAMLRDLLALVGKLRDENTKTKAQDSGARELLAELIALSHEQDGRRRFVVEEGSEFWRRAAVLARLPKEQLELEFPSKRPAARLVDPPHREKWRWWAG